jgi:hypothetical protein
MSIARFGAQLCGRIRRLLDAYLSNELLVETTGDVLRHLEACPACAREIESRVRLRDALRRAASAQIAPDYLRQEIHQRLRKTQRAFWAGIETRNWAMALAGVAAVILCAILGQQWRRIERQRNLVASILKLGVADHLHCAIQSHNYPDVAYPSAQLRKKLGPEYAGLLNVVEQNLPHFQVLEAHICSVPGSPRQYVHFIARGHGTILSVILTKRNGLSLPRGTMTGAGTSGGVPLYSSILSGMEVVGFQYQNYFGFVVSGLGKNLMLQSARGLAPGMQEALNAVNESENRGKIFFRTLSIQTSQSSGV